MTARLAVYVACLILLAPRAFGKTAEDYTVYSTGIAGQAGLLRVLTATKTPDGTLTNRGSMGYFRCPGLCGRNTFFSTSEGHERIDGTFSATFSPDFVKKPFDPADGFEFSFSYIGAYHVVDDISADTHRPSAAVGDIEGGVKYVLPRPWLPEFLHLGVSTFGKLYSALGDVGMQADSISPSVRLLTTVDLLKYAPVQFHLNLGYGMDNSMKIFDPKSPIPDRSRRFAQGVTGEDSVIFGAALAAPLPRVVPYLEIYGLIDADGSGIDSSGAAVPIRNFRENPWTITPGVRGYFTKRAAAEVAVDLGYLSDRFPSSSANASKALLEDIVPPIRLNVAVSYSFTPKIPKLIRRAPVGRILGKVVDAASKEAVGFAVLSFPGRDMANIASNRDSGEFEIEKLKPGPYTLVVSHPGYENVSLDAEVKANQNTEVQVELKKVFTIATVTGRLTDPTGHPVQGVVHFLKAKEKVPSTFSTDPATGVYSASLPEGEFKVHAQAPGFLPSTDQAAALKAGESFEFNFVLQPKPEPKLAKVTENKIEILQTIHFETGRNIIKPISFPVLDDVSQILVDRKEFKVRVEGHTDNVGGFQINMKLSQARAESVMRYLIGKGVAADRLVAVGLGPQFPIADNTTERGRAQNRRVEFIILSGNVKLPVQLPKPAAAPSWVTTAKEPFALVYDAKEGKAVARAKKGRRFRFVARDGDWISIRLPSGKTGWVREADITLE
ncbi:MAG: carboxypeptidase regulatory-like domain-containing protein [Nitrospirae bacterium]|nr:carboxypeptidase regulatory-like domain-containing protein [Nitrospirota bacterium]